MNLFFYKHRLLKGLYVFSKCDSTAKYAVSEVIGYLKGKSAIAVARQFAGRQKNFNGEHFWSRGYAVSRRARFGIIFGIKNA